MTHDEDEVTTPGRIPGRLIDVEHVPDTENHDEVTQVDTQHDRVQNDGPPPPDLEPDLPPPPEH